MTAAERDDWYRAIDRRFYLMMASGFLKELAARSTEPKTKAAVMADIKRIDDQIDTTFIYRNGK